MTKISSQEMIILTEVIRKYGIFIIILGFILTVVCLWILLARNNLNKIPSRGVFVDNYEVRRAVL